MCHFLSIPLALLVCVIFGSGLGLMGQLYKMNVKANKYFASIYLLAMFVPDAPGESYTSQVYEALVQLHHRRVENFTTKRKIFYCRIYTQVCNKKLHKGISKM